jgi:hypothetical protein
MNSPQKNMVPFKISDTENKRMDSENSRLRTETIKDSGVSPSNSDRASLTSNNAEDNYDFQF